MKLQVGHLCAAIILLYVAQSSNAQVLLLGVTGNPTPTISSNFLVDIDIATGAATSPRNIGTVSIGVSSQPSTGSLFGLTDNFVSPANTLIRINQLTGAHTVVGATGLPLIVEGDLAFNPTNGFLYGIQDAGSDVMHRNFFRIDPETGSATVISNLPFNNNSTEYSSLAFSSNGTLYCIDDGPSGNSRLLIINAGSGVITSDIAMNVHLGGANGMAFHPITGTAYVADGGPVGTGLLYTLDVTTGILTSVGPTGIAGGIAGLTFVSVPEPSSIALLVGPLFALVRIARSRHFRLR